MQIAIDETVANWKATKEDILSKRFVPVNYDPSPNEATVAAVKSVYERAKETVRPMGYRHIGWFNNCVVFAFEKTEPYCDTLVFEVEQWAIAQGYRSVMTQRCAEGVFCLCISLP